LIKNHITAYIAGGYIVASKYNMNNCKEQVFILPLKQYRTLKLPQIGMQAKALDAQRLTQIA